jgi:hypothetical protein
MDGRGFRSRELLLLRSRVQSSPKAAAKSSVSPTTRTYIVFHGNGCSFLRTAFGRREGRWGGAVCGAGDSNTARQSSESPSSSDENLVLTKRLTEGGIAFVFRDLLTGPHWAGGGMPKGQKPPSLSLYASHYPAKLADGLHQTCNRWPKHASLTSKDGSLKSLVAYYQAQALSPWFFIPLSFCVPNLKLLKADVSTSAAWGPVALAHGLVARGADPRVESDQSHHNIWLLKPVRTLTGSIHPSRVHAPGGS